MKRSRGAAGEVPTAKRLKKTSNSMISAVEGGPVHKKGSIYRVAMHNFVTYNDCEFFPGPLLNVVIGPNGSGKSSIVCGLVLGLGGAPKLLGRAKKLSEFIRHGSEVAWVELELARASSNGKNVTIRRTLRKDNTSEWHLNGSLATKVEVKALIDSVNIQIDNVCQFLPQDKVVEFAKLDQYELLKETEKAVGSDGMFADHERLIKKHKNKCDFQLQVGTRQKRLEELQASNELLERDVLRFREREKLLKEANEMKLKKLWVEYNEIREALTLAEEKLQNSKKKHKLAEAECLPLEKEVEQKRQEMAQVESSRTKRLADLQAIDKERKKLIYRISQLDDKFQDTLKALERLKSQHADREKQVKQAEQQIRSSEEQLRRLEQSAQSESRESLAQRTKAVLEQTEELRSQLDQISFSYQTLIQDDHALKAQIESLNNHKHQRLETLRSFNRDAYEAHTWIKAQEAEGKLRDKVYGPVLLEVNLTNPFHVKCFENQVSNAVLSTFLTLNPEDHEHVISNLYEKQKLKINIVRAYQIQGSFEPPSMDPLRPLGVTGFLVEFVEAPDIVRRMLCANSGIHTAAITEGRVDGQEVIDKANLSRLFTPQSMYTSQRSLYGNRARSTMIVGLKDRRLIRGVDLSRLQQSEADRATIRARIHEEDQKKRDLEGQLRTASKSLDELHNQRDRISRELSDRKRLVHQIEAKKGLLAELLVEEDTSGRENRVIAQLQKILEEQANLSIKLGKIIEQLTSKALKIDFHVLTRAEIAIAVSLKERELATKRSAFEELKRAVDVAFVEVKELKSEANEAKRVASRAAPMTEELKEVFTNFPDTINELNEKIAETETRANMNYRANPHLIEDYENRRAEIKKLQEDVDGMNQSAEDINAEIDEIKVSLDWTVRVFGRTTFSFILLTSLLSVIL